MSANSHEFLSDYFGRLRRVTENDPLLFDQINLTRKLWLGTKRAGGRVIFVGNGGSAGIASHLAIDLSKNAGVPATCFNDASLMTCLANDYGFEHWMAHALRLNGGKDDTLVAISSSGRSKNILNAVAQARQMGMKVVTLSGMSPDNPLRKQGDINFWADSHSYNIVETAHQFWMMSTLDLIIDKAEYPAS